MKAPDTLALNFEKHARTDWKMWFTTSVGLGLLLGVSVIETDVSGWVPTVFAACLFVMGLGLLGIGGLALGANAARGCKVDLDAGILTWWKMKGARWFEARGEVRLDDVRQIAVRSKERQDVIRLYDQKGELLVALSPLVLPPKHKDWVETLCSQYPHIELKLIYLEPD